MSALFHNIPVVHHQNKIRVLDRGESVGDDEAGFACHQIPDGLLNLPLGVGVDVAGRLVQYQHAGVIQHGPRDGQQLLLAFRNVAAVLGNHRVVALREPHDIIVDPRGLRGGDDFLF